MKRKKRLVAVIEGRRIYSSAGVITTKQVIVQPDSVVIIPFLNENEVVMISQYRAYSWEGAPRASRR